MRKRSVKATKQAVKRSMMNVISFERAPEPPRAPQPQRSDMQAVYGHRDKLEKELLTYLKRLWQVPDGNLLAFMRTKNSELVNFLADEERLLSYHAGEYNMPGEIQ